MAARTLQRIRFVPLSKAPLSSPTLLGPRGYHSYESESPAIFNATEEAILSAAIPHVPEHGFTNTSLTLGAKDAGYLDLSVNLFPRGAFDLINYHLVTQRLALKDRVQLTASVGGGKKLGIGAKVRLLAAERLMANRATIHRWPEVLSQNFWPRG